MAIKYSNYIQLSPNYESVVDLDAEERHPNLWQEYIVHEDMRKTVEAICQTMEAVNPKKLIPLDKRRSFWIHGAYGTGKSYAAIVLKHLFEDKLKNIESFLQKQKLAPLKKRFLEIREKGDFLVAWKSGATGIKSGTQLMLEMEVIIKEKLKERFGDKAYYGQSSLINATKAAIEDPFINWGAIFDDPIYAISDKYNSLEEFRQSVLSGDKDDIDMVKRVCDDRGFALFAGVVERFEEWLQDIIAGNGLRDTGIVFIWDEFTKVLRECGDDNVLQRLSEFCKQPNSPFFMCLIVHRDPTWVDQLGNKTYERILHRYHELEFHITESAAYDLIGDSILAQPGMEVQWEDEKKRLVNSIEKWKSEFDNLEQNINIYERMNKLCPLHPMTVSMLATVAQGFGASQRTLFRFMKDRNETTENVGFVHYINTQGPNDWYWLTVDYLWDYFFTRKSDVRDFNADVKKVIQHFETKKELISDEYSMHVFKAALLLVSVVAGTNVSQLYSKSYSNNQITATKRSLYKIFRGQLTEEQVDEYLNAFEQIGVLRLDYQKNGDARLELPYTGNLDLFDVRLEAVKKRYSRYNLFSKPAKGFAGAFSKAMEDYLWDSTKATFGRMYIAVCSSETTSFNNRLGEVKAELSKHPYKVGLLVASVSKQNDFMGLQSLIKEHATKDETKRLVIALLKEPCTDEIIDRWHRAVTNKELSEDDGKAKSASDYEAEAYAEIATWAGTASEAQIFACYGDLHFPQLYGKSDLIKRVESDVLYTIFPAAPEKIVLTNTAFKKANGAGIAGLTKETKNAQVNNIVNALKSINAWDIDDIKTLTNLQGTNSIAITQLAKFMDSELERGAKIPLDTLWEKLKQPPFGYYNSMAAEVFVGLVLRSHINGAFNWIDHQNNTHQPTAKKLAAMIKEMMSGQMVNNYLSSGSAIWQKFKPYAKAVFGLMDNECVSDTEARKFILSKIATIGVPLWSLKAVPADKLGGDEVKTKIDKLTESFCDFVYKVSHDQESVMADIFTFFTGRGELKKVITTTINDKTVMYAAFKRFVFSESAELENLYVQLNLTDKDLFDNIRNYLQSALHTWKEDEVRAKLPEMAQELNVILILNAALGVTEKSYVAIQRMLNNLFEHMKIPGMVVETLNFSWIPALKLLRHISKSPWSNVSGTPNILEILENAKIAWGFVSQPKIILEMVLKKRGVFCDEEELSKVCMELKQTIYETPEQVFYATLDKLLDNVSECRKIIEIKSLWETNSKTKSIRDWCNSVNCPILWLFDSAYLGAIVTIVALQEGKTADKNALSDALEFLKSNNFAVLFDTKLITDRFFANIGESYREVFESDSETLYARLKTNSELKADVYSWHGKIVQMREVIDGFLRSKHLQTAKERTKTMSVEQLREIAMAILESSPQLYTYFLKK
jgi:hypothetical protein